MTTDIFGPVNFDPKASKLPTIIPVRVFGLLLLLFKIFFPFIELARLIGCLTPVIDAVNLFFWIDVASGAGTDCFF